MYQPARPKRSLLLTLVRNAARLFASKLLLCTTRTLPRRPPLLEALVGAPNPKLVSPAASECWGRVQLALLFDEGPCRVIDGALTEVRAGRLAARSRRGRATFTCARGEVEGGGGGRVSRALPVAGAGEAGRGATWVRNGYRDVGRARARVGHRRRNDS